MEALQRLWYATAVADLVRRRRPLPP